jgi:hypothetical protein
MLVGARACPACNRPAPGALLGEVGDERHLIFTCPALEHIRGRYRHLFGPRTFTMVQSLWQENLVSVARFVTDFVISLRSADPPSHQPLVAGMDVISLSPSLSLSLSISQS